MIRHRSLASSSSLWSASSTRSSCFTRQRGPQSIAIEPRSELRAMLRACRPGHHERASEDGAGVACALRSFVSPRRKRPARERCSDHSARRSIRRPASDNTARAPRGALAGEITEAACAGRQEAFSAFSALRIFAANAVRLSAIARRLDLRPLTCGPSSLPTSWSRTRSVPSPSRCLSSLTIRV